MDMEHIVFNDTPLALTPNYPHFWKTEPLLTGILCVAYGLVFITGLVGNLFVVLAVIVHPSMRNITNYFIMNLAIADLLIMVFCLPATLMNNVLSEWPFGTIMCKLSIWGNAMATGVSVFTLVAVTADRYTAICHTMKYSTLRTRYTYYIIGPIWIFSGLMFLHYLLYSNVQSIPIMTANDELIPIYPELHMAAAKGWNVTHYPQFHQYQALNICHTQMSEFWSKLTFLFINILLAYMTPLIFITVFYIFIFTAVYKHARMQLAVDHKAAEREQRMKLRITVMMLTVIVVFALTWLPLYGLYTYILFIWDQQSETGPIVINYVRPVFQWLSMLNSCVNPILYAFFSLKFRSAFTKICLLPCMRRYNRARDYTRDRLFSHVTNKSVGDGHSTSLSNQTKTQSIALLTNGNAVVVEKTNGHNGSGCRLSSAVKGGQTVIADRSGKITRQRMSDTQLKETPVAQSRDLRAKSLGRIGHLREIPEDPKHAASVEPAIVEFEIDETITSGHLDDTELCTLLSSSNSPMITTNINAQFTNNTTV